MTASAITEIGDICSAPEDLRLAVTYEPLDEPNEALFEQLAEHSPMRLLQLVASRTLPPPLMTFAAELAGHCPMRESAAAVLLSLLSDPSPLVREGAIYGLEHLTAVPGVRAAIEWHTTSEFEPSPGVRAAATEALELS